jgi:2-succinyl-5-enolpyruvyl-6-hydroxy-3-cyclohexene-1-carboxylate synthase
MTLDLEANEVEVKVLTSLASVAERTGRGHCVLKDGCVFIEVWFHEPFLETETNRERGGHQNPKLAPWTKFGHPREGRDSEQKAAANYACFSGHFTQM